MAKQAKQPVREKLVEDMKFERGLKKEIRMWNFGNSKTFIGRIIEEIEKGEPLKYGGYLAEEAHTKEKYYLPKHDRIVEGVEEFGTEGTFKIVHLETTKFENNTREYNSYDVYFEPDNA